nr:hypothetical transcript [Hymenolepis microstoma]
MNYTASKQLLYCNTGRLKRLWSAHCSQGWIKKPQSHSNSFEGAADREVYRDKLCVSDTIIVNATHIMRTVRSILSR